MKCHWSWLWATMTVVLCKNQQKQKQKKNPLNRHHHSYHKFYYCMIVIVRLFSFAKCRLMLLFCVSQFWFLLGDVYSISKVVLPFILFVQILFTSVPAFQLLLLSSAIFWLSLYCNSRGDGDMKSGWWLRFDWVDFSLIFVFPVNMVQWSQLS